MLVEVLVTLSVGRYSQTVKEALALLWVCGSFTFYLNDLP